MRIGELAGDPGIRFFRPPDKRLQPAPEWSHRRPLFLVIVNCVALVTTSWLPLVAATPLVPHGAAEALTVKRR